jgi:hypothetical protein
MLSMIAFDSFYSSSMGSTHGNEEKIGKRREGKRKGE